MAKAEIRKIVITGPESVGKSTLCKQLAEYFNTVCIDEYAREFVEKQNGKYSFEDVEHIAEIQFNKFSQTIEGANNYVFFDTGLIITKVWFEEVYKKIPIYMNRFIMESAADMYLLSKPDIEWKRDSVRENSGEMRDYLFGKYKQNLEYYGFNYKEIEGKGEQRFLNALKAVNPAHHLQF